MLWKKITTSFLIFFITINPAAALEQNVKFWPGLYIQQKIPKHEKWQYLLFTQARFIDDSHPWQSALIEGGVGYLLTPNHSLWAGYRLTVHNVLKNSFQENRFFQQLIWKVKDENKKIILSRTRFEELNLTNQTSTYYRVRERITFEQMINYKGKINPFYWNEAFFPLNKPNYVSHNFINENRLFIGFRYYTTPHTNWEIGYINQTQFETRKNIQDKMYHILTIVYNFV